VTAGAKKTATQSDLTTSVDSATALYTKTQNFPIYKTTAGTKAVTATVLPTAMHKTQATITYVKGTVAPKAAKNSVSIVGLPLPGITTGAVVVMTAIDGTTACWAVIMNESSSTVTMTAAAGGKTGVAVSGTHYYGWAKGATGYPTGCKADSVANLAPATVAKFMANFKTVKGVT